MPAFSIAPVGPFPDPASGPFPDFMQFQASGVNLGDRAADTLNFASGLAATRGVGEQANIVTVAATPFAGVVVESAGVALGSALTLNFTGGLSASLAGTIASIIAGSLNWRTVLGDATILDADLGNGLWVNITSGASVVSVPPMPPGASVLLEQAGPGPVMLVPQSGVTLLYRTSAFLAQTAGQGAILTLIAGPADSNAVVVCGDMAAA